MLTPPGRQPSRPVPLPLRHSLLGSVAVIVHGIRYFYCLGGHALAVAGYQPGPSLTTRRFPLPSSETTTGCRYLVSYSDTISVSLNYHRNNLGSVLIPARFS